MPGSAAATAAELVAALRDGDRRALARAISRIEDGHEHAPEIVKGAFEAGVGAWVLGITGGTGAGKSTLVDALVTRYRAAEDSVGIVAVDPTSPFTGGALLGDRVRMQRHGIDPGVFIRSMATRGAHGGLAAATYDVVTLLAAAGFRRLLVETVGVGQEELDVAGVAHTTAVVVTPAGGDGVQAIKAGIMEIADIIVLNKADLSGADRTESQLRAVVSHAPDSDWIPPIVRTVASRDEGIEELLEAVAKHRAWAEGSGQLQGRRRAVAALRVRGLLADALWRRARALVEAEQGALDRIAAGETDPYTVSEELVERLLREGP